MLPSGCYDQPDIVPYAKTTIPQSLPESLSLGFNPNYTTDVSQSRGLVQWLVNDTPMAVDLQVPTLQSVLDGNVTTGTNSHVFKVEEKSEVSFFFYFFLHDLSKQQVVFILLLLLLLLLSHQQQNL